MLRLSVVAAVILALFAGIAAAAQTKPAAPQVQVWATYAYDAATGAGSTCKVLAVRCAG